jgi:hypothetical protein
VDTNFGVKKINMRQTLVAGISEFDILDAPTLAQNLQEYPINYTTDQLIESKRNSKVILEI